MRSIEEVMALGRQATADDLAVLVRQAAPHAHATDAVVYLIDYQRTHLMPLSAPGAPGRTELVIEGTLAGRCFTTGVRQRADNEHLWYLPLTDGARRLGVLEITGGAPDPVAGERLADLAALLITSRESYGDLVEQTRRRLPMQLAAEVVWNLLPPVTVETPEVTIAGILEPCYEVGGDVFDYAINRGVAHFALFDAMGHGMQASMQASVAVNCYRNARRCGLDLLDTYRSLDSWQRNQRPDGFVTAFLAELDTDTGLLRYITAGHPGPLVLRGGQMVKALTAPTAMPLGLEDTRARVDTERLEPGDRLLCYTDGMVEARDAHGAFFGRDRLVEFTVRVLADEVAVPEAMRRMIHAVLAHQHDVLQDDASALIVHWRDHQPPAALAGTALAGTVA